MINLFDLENGANKFILANAFRLQFNLIIRNMN